MAKPKINEEKIHNQLWFDLCDVTEKAGELSVPHIVHMGIQFFTRMALDCAPNEIIGLGVVLDTIRDVKRDDESDE